MRIMYFLAVVMVSFPFFNTAHSQEVCDILANNLKQDVLEQGTDLQQLQQWQIVVRQDRYRDFSTANSEKIDSSLTVVDVVDTGLSLTGAISGKSDSSTWERDRQNFLNMQSSFSTFSSSATLRIRQASAAAYNKIVQCAQMLADKLGVFGIFKAPNFETFSIKIVHRDVASNAFKIDSFTVAPQSAIRTCDQHVLDASPSHPVQAPVGEFIVQCEKVPDREATVTINTSAGTVGPFTANSSTNEFDDIKSQIAQARDQITQLSEKNQRLGEQNQHLSDAIQQLSLRISNIGTNRGEACYLDGRHADGGGSGETHSCRPGFLATGAKSWSDSAILTWVQCCPVE